MSIQNQCVIYEAFYSKQILYWVHTYCKHDYKEVLSDIGVFTVSLPWSYPVCIYQPYFSFMFRFHSAFDSFEDQKQEWRQ